MNDKVLKSVSPNITPSQGVMKPLVKSLINRPKIPAMINLLAYSLSIYFYSLFGQLVLFEATGVLYIDDKNKM